MPFKELSVKQWNSEINHALEYRREYGLEESWAQLEAMFYDTFKEADCSGPNIISAVGDAMLSQLSVPDPYILISPRRFSLVEQAPVLEAVSNDISNEIQVKEEVSDALLHAYLWGTGILKIGYDSEQGYDPLLDIVPNSGISMTQFNARMRRIEYNDIHPGWPWVRAVLPHDFLVPWGVYKLKNSPWCIHRIVRHIDDVRSDLKYSGTRELRPTMSMEDFVKSYLSATSSHRMGEELSSLGGLAKRDGGEAEYVELWEIHDRRTNKVLVTATGHDRFLRNDHDHLQREGLPFVEISLVPRARTFWTTSDAYQLRAHQAELNDITIQASKQRRINILKFLYLDGAMEEEEVEKILSADVGVAAKVNRGQSLHDAITTFTANNSNLALYQDGETVRRNARESVGLSRNQLGEFEASGRRTATEARSVDQSSQLRMSRRGIILADTYSRLFKKIHSIIFEFWKTPRVISVVGPEGVAAWKIFTGQQLEGDYGMEIGFSTKPESLGSRKQEALSLFTQLMKDPYVDPIALHRYFIHAFADPRLRAVFRPEISNPLALVQASKGPLSPLGGESADQGSPPSSPLSGSLPLPSNQPQLRLGGAG